MKQFRGEKEARVVIDWLNGVERKTYYSRPEPRKNKNTKASRARIKDLLSAIQELKAALAKIPDYRYGETRCREAEKLEEEISARLYDYPLVPFIIPEDGGYLFGDRIVVGSRAIGESLAALNIVELVNMNLVDRISSCLCGRYFFARLPKQSFCSATCRHKGYEQTEAFKAQRREYMRKYYKLKTSGKVK